MLDHTVKCRICGDPYKFLSMIVRDQSACPKCVAEAERNMSGYAGPSYAKRPVSPTAQVAWDEQERRRRGDTAGTNGGAP